MELAYDDNTRFIILITNTLLLEYSLWQIYAYEGN